MEFHSTVGDGARSLPCTAYALRVHRVTVARPEGFGPSATSKAKSKELYHLCLTVYTGTGIYSTGIEERERGRNQIMNQMYNTSEQRSKRGGQTGRRVWFYSIETQTGPLHAMCVVM